MGSSKSSKYLKQKTQVWAWDRAKTFCEILPWVEDVLWLNINNSVYRLFLHYKTKKQTKNKEVLI